MSRPPLPHLRRDWAHPRHICSETAPAPATSALRLSGPTPATSASGLGLTPATSAPGLGSPPATSAPGLGLPPALSVPGLGSTPAASAAGPGCRVCAKLDHLAACNVNVIQLLPMADFAGSRNWGCPLRSYARPCRSGCPCICLPQRCVARSLRRRRGLLSAPHPVEARSP